MILLAVDYINKDCRMPEIESDNKHVNTCICDVPSMPFPLLIVSVFLLQVLQMHFLTVCWNLVAYGSAFFTGYVQRKVVNHFSL